MSPQGDRPGGGGGESALHPVTLKDYTDWLKAYFDKYAESEKELLAAKVEWVKSELKRVWDKFGSVQTAVDKAEDGANERFKSGNEFRDSLSDLSKDMATRNELAGLKDTLASQLGSARNELLAMKEAFDAKIAAGLASAQTARESLERSHGDRLDSLEDDRLADQTRREEGKKAIDSRFRTFGVIIVLINLGVGVVIFLLTNSAKK